MRSWPRRRFRTCFDRFILGEGVYWDGLFSQNPPIRELIDARPDEIWVIQINPKEREDEPRTITEIADRRNELAGNLSLYQELHFIENVDRMLDEGLLAPDGRYKSIVVRVIELSRAHLPQRLGAASKLNRDPTFIADLIAHGEERAEEFLVALAFEDAWKRRDAEAVMEFFTDESELTCAPPFRAPGPYRGRKQIARCVARHLTKEVTINLSRKQVARDTVTWTVRFDQGHGTQVDGSAQAGFVGNTVTTLRLGAPAPG